jgi:hypothetical protein
VIRNLGGKEDGPVQTTVSLDEAYVEREQIEILGCGIQKICDLFHF